MGMARAVPLCYPETAMTIYGEKKAHFIKGALILPSDTKRHWQVGLTYNAWLTLIHITARGAPREFFMRPPFNRSTQWRVRKALVAGGFISEETRIWPDAKTRKRRTAYGITTD